MLMVRRLAKEEALFAGGSTGVNVVAALDVAGRVNDPQALVVTVLADTGERYLSKVFNDEWLRENQILEAERVSVAQLLEARNSGAPPLISVAPTATVRQALNLMGTYNVSQLPVLDVGDGVGAVSEQGLMARALEDPSTLDRPVQDLMDAPFPVVDADLPVERLTTLLSRETPAASRGRARRPRARDAVERARRAQGGHRRGRPVPLLARWPRRGRDPASGARRDRRALYRQRSVGQRARHGQGPRQAAVPG